MICASLKELGKTPWENDRLVRFVTIGVKTGKHDLRRHVGNRSSGDDFGGRLRRRSATCDSDTTGKSASDFVG